MSQHYCKEKFHLAILDLVAPGDIHTRLQAAWSQHLIHLDPKSDFDEKNSDSYLRLKENVMPNIRNNFSDLSEYDAEKLAQETVHLYEEILSS